MHYIILDLEWNQPPHPKRMVKKPVSLVGEIIQIGAAKVDEAMTVVDSYKTMVCPAYYTRMHKHVARVTGLTDDDLIQGLPFAEAFEDFAKWCGEDCIIFTWGPDDIPMLRTNMLLHNISCPLPPCYDLQVIYDGQIAHENRQHSLTAVMETLGEQALDAHDALNDALNTAKVCKHLDIKKGLADYPTPSRGGYERKGEAFATKEEALASVSTLYCPSCGEKLICEPIKHTDARHSECDLLCSQGHALKITFRFVKWADRLLTVSRVIEEKTEDSQNAPPQKKRRRRRKKTCEANTTRL